MAAAQKLRSTFLWCTVASDAPIAAIFARLGTGKRRWSCVLRWDLDEHEIIPGAMTTLHLMERRCRLSSDGTFLLYVASGPLGGPFSRYYGGGAAISRLPWLAALTDIVPASVAGGGKSRHALAAADQDALWRMFKGRRLYVAERDWPSYYGDSWKGADSGLYPASAVERLRNRPARMVGCATLAKRGLRLVIIADRKRPNDDRNDRPRFFLEATHPSKRGTLRSLPDVTWATPIPDGSFLAIGHTGRVTRLFPKIPGDPATPLRVVEDHDLTRIKVASQAAPAWATQPF